MWRSRSGPGPRRGGRSAAGAAERPRPSGPGAAMEDGVYGEAAEGGGSGAGTAAGAGREPGPGGKSVREP